MYNPKVHSVYHNVEKQFSDICSELKSFMRNISEWGDELVEIVKKEYTTGKETALFLLPKTPGEKKTGNRKNKKALMSKCSIVNSTFLNNETGGFDESVSLRTRGARRAASKMSQLNVTREVNKTHLETGSQSALNTTESTKGELSDATYVMQMSSTRTKPVFKGIEVEAIVPEIKTPENNKISTSEPPTPTPETKESPPKKISQTPPQRVTRSESSKTPKDAQEETEKAPFVINETPVDRLSRRKTSRTLSGSPTERQRSRKLFRSLSGSPVVRSSSLRSSKNGPKSPAPTRNSSRIDTDPSTNQYMKSSTPESRSPRINRTVTIKKEPMPSATSTFIVTEETNDEEEVRTPIVGEGRFFRLSKTSTPAFPAEKSRTREISTVGKSDDEATKTTTSNVATGETVTDDEVPKKKRKLKKDEEVKENIEEVGDTVRITRTKSKAIKKMMEENERKQPDLSAFAKKLLNKAKKTSLKKNQLAALLDCNSSTPTNGPGTNLPFGALTASKCHFLLSSSKVKTPLATLPNSAMKIAKPSGDKPRIASRDTQVENAVRSVTKPLKQDVEKEMKLKSKKEKEEEAALKRQIVIKNKQEELKRKNELKHQLAMKQREKLEQEKYNNMIQSEKEKEERHKLILQERQMKLKEEALKKKVLTQQKIAETTERRRQEEEARIAKLKEMEAEEQRLALEKQKEQERQEKRAQERLAQKKAREEYELQLKQEMEAERLKAEKLLTGKKCVPGTTGKRQKAGVKREWDYKPRNENDYGLEDEHSEVDSDDEKSYDKAKPAVPWGKKIMHGKSPFVKVLTLEMMCEFMPCYQKSPDIHRMFKMTPSKRLKRTSSAIWNTPSS